MKIIILFFFLITFQNQMIYCVPINYNGLSEDEINIQNKNCIKKSLHNNIKSQLNQTGEDTFDSFKIFQDEQILYSEKKKYYPYYSQGLIADIDKNGLDDIFFEYSIGRQGLNLGCGIAFYMQQNDKTFKKLSLVAECFSLNDIFDIDGDGQFEIITTRLIKYNSHSYWVYRCWQIKNSEVISVDYKFGFPRAIWFTHKPNKKLEKKEILEKIMINY